MLAQWFLSQTCPLLATSVVVRFDLLEQICETGSGRTKMSSYQIAASSQGVITAVPTAAAITLIYVTVCLASGRFSGQELCAGDDAAMRLVHRPTDAG